MPKLFNSIFFHFFFTWTGSLKLTFGWRSLDRLYSRLFCL